MSVLSEAQAALAELRQTTLGFKKAQLANPTTFRRTHSGLAESHLVDAVRALGGAAELAPTPTSPPPPPPEPLPIDNSLAQSWCVLGDNPKDALHTNPHYKLAVTADLGYRNWYDADFFSLAKGRVVAPWCDCKADSGWVPGVGTAPDVAIEWMHQLGAPFWCGEAENAEAFDRAVNANPPARVIWADLGKLRPDQHDLIVARKVLVAVEWYRNCNAGPLDWHNDNAGIGGTLHAKYADKQCPGISDDELLRLFNPGDSIYGPQVSPALYARLP